jgi:hypothetical protein
MKKAVTTAKRFKPNMKIRHELSVRLGANREAQADTER